MKVVEQLQKVHCYNDTGPDQLAVGNVMDIIQLKLYSVKDCCRLACCTDYELYYKAWTAWMTHFT